MTVSLKPLPLCSAPPNTQGAGPSRVHWRFEWESGLGWGSGARGTGPTDRQAEAAAAQVLELPPSGRPGPLSSQDADIPAGDAPSTQTSPSSPGLRLHWHQRHRGRVLAAHPALGPPGSLERRCPPGPRQSRSPAAECLLPAPTSQRAFLRRGAPWSALLSHSLAAWVQCGLPGPQLGRGHLPGKGVVPRPQDRSEVAFVCRKSCPVLQGCGPSSRSAHRG